MKALKLGYLATTAVALAACFAVGGCTGNGSADSGNRIPGDGKDALQPLTIDGSTTIFPVAQAMAEDFGKDNPTTAHRP